jgi:hypothetical protein
MNDPQASNQNEAQQQDEENERLLWEEIDRHFEDAATAYQRLPKEQHVSYLSCAMTAWEMVNGVKTLAAEELKNMVDDLHRMAEIHRRIDASLDEDQAE